MKNAEMYVNMGVTLLYGVLGTALNKAAATETSLKSTSLWNVEDPSQPAQTTATQTPAESSAEEPEDFSPFTDDSQYKDLSEEDVLRKVFKDYDNRAKYYQTRFITKYKTMIDIAKQNRQTLSDDIITTRLQNYARGLSYHNFGLEADKGKIGSFKNTPVSNLKLSDLKQKYINEGLEEKTAETKAKEEMLQTIKASYLQFGKEYVELYDIDGDGTVNLDEMFRKELTDYYQAQNMSANDIMTKVNEAAAKAKNGTLKEASEEEKIYYGVVSQMVNLDHDNNDELSANEAGAYIMSTALLYDNDHQISTLETSTAKGFIQDFDTSANIFNSDDSKIKQRGNENLDNEEIEERIESFAEDTGIPVEILKAVKAKSVISDSDKAQLAKQLSDSTGKSLQEAEQSIETLLAYRKFTENLNAYQAFLAE